ncbi:MAG: helix-turn-helix transcriptional regulator [Lachnospiraceae bacterium]|nr:helix-turn-helix transcriptional regulator [Lachnospiraceae bacterium]
MSLQEAIRMLRGELGLTQAELADKLGISFASVNRWENGKNYPSKAVAKSVLETVQSFAISEECKSYLYEILTPSRRKFVSAAGYGFPEVDQELLCQLVDRSANSIFVIDAENLNIIYVNRATEKMALSGSFNADRRKCYQYIKGKEMPCENCPLRNMQENGYTDEILHCKKVDAYYRIRGRKTIWNEKEIYIIYGYNVTDFIKNEQQVLAEG